MIARHNDANYIYVIIHSFYSLSTWKHKIILNKDRTR